MRSRVSFQLHTGYPGCDIYSFTQVSGEKVWWVKVNKMSLDIGAK